MTEFKQLAGQVGALLDAERISNEEAGVIIARYICGELGCSRVSIWTLQGDVGRREMKRIGGFDASTNAPMTHLAVLPEADCGACIDTLTSKGVYACNDASADARLTKLRLAYLLSNDIQAMLAATIGTNGSTSGVLCCAQQGRMRRWSPREITLVKRFADEISLRRARRREREGEALTLMQSLMQ